VIVISSGLLLTPCRAARANYFIMGDYLCKPVNPQELCDMLEKWIAKMDSSHRSAVDF
jgi:YesN/AraC family two-component response regulator